MLIKLKKLSLLFFVFIGLSLSLRANPFPLNRHLKTLLDSGEYFQFRHDFEEEIPASSYAEKWFWEPEHLYFLAWDNYLFNKSKTSNHNIESLLSDSKFTCPDSIIAEMLQLHYQNDLRLFQYKTADSICNILLFRFPSVIDPQVLAGIKNSSQITAALISVPPQTIERNGELVVKYKRDIANLIKVPVTMNNKSDDFIFDTGANFSTISESEAKKMNVHMLNATFGVMSSSKASVSTGLGVADKLEIGNVIFRNVVFLVMPDKALKFLGGLYKIKGIIGLPVIAQMGQIEIRKNHNIIGTTAVIENHILNLGLEGNTPFVAATFFEKEHIYIFDTGAAASVFGKRFNAAYAEKLTTAKDGTAHVGGAGGVQKVVTRTAKNISYNFGKGNSVLKVISIQLNGVSDAIGNFYGIIGEDVFMHWEVMTINFDLMFVEVR